MTPTVAIIILGTLVPLFLSLILFKQAIKIANILRIEATTRELSLSIKDFNNEIKRRKSMTENTEAKFEFELNGVTYAIADNSLTLQELTEVTDEPEAYTEYLEVITGIIKELYQKYRFIQGKPTIGDYQSGYYLSFTISRANLPTEYEFLFRTAISNSLNIDTVNSLFIDLVKDGSILDLGDVEITEGTALSPATQGDDIIANIVFMPRDYYEKHLELVEGETND